MDIIGEFKGRHRFLSNFYPAEVVLDGTPYPDVEHAYQAAKTLDRLERARIAACRTPGGAKRLGRKATIRPNWEGIKLGIMFGLLQQKFQLVPFTELLRATGDSILIEGNTWGDRYWGADLNTGEGENRLGRMLMLIRVENG